MIAARTWLSKREETKVPMARQTHPKSQNPSKATKLSLKDTFPKIRRKKMESVISTVLMEKARTMARYLPMIILLTDTGEVNSNTSVLFFRSSVKVLIVRSGVVISMIRSTPPKVAEIEGEPERRLLARK
jgi:hypothetical protein